MQEKPKKKKKQELKDFLRWFWGEKKIPAVSHLGHVLLPCTLEFSYKPVAFGGQFILKWV